MFPKFTGAKCPCPKCGTPLGTVWHAYGLADWTTLRSGPIPCWDLQGWPQTEGGGAVEPDDKSDEEHLHRICNECGFQAIEALATPEQRVAARHYEQIYGLKSINEKAALGWRVVGLLMPGADMIALMESP